jgi:Fungal specific transcription factor domain
LQSQHADSSSCQWLFYIDGAKNVIKASYSSNGRDQGNEYNALLDWVFYQDTMAQFSFRHWQSQTHSSQGPSFDRLVMLLTMPPKKETLQVPSHLLVFSLFVQQLTVWYQLSQPSLSHFKLLGLLSEVCSAIQDVFSPESRGEAYKDQLKLLEWKVSQIIKGDVTECFYANDTPLCLESFQLAVLIYLSRISGTAETHPETTQSRLDRAFAIFAEMEICVREFPLAILGCEARNDLERMTALDLIDRTQTKSPNRSYLGLRNLIQSLWAQDDLAEEQLEYTRKLTAVFSASEVLPALL